DRLPRLADRFDERQASNLAGRHLVSPHTDPLQQLHRGNGEGRREKLDSQLVAAGLQLAPLPSRKGGAFEVVISRLRPEIPRRKRVPQALGTGDVRLELDCVHATIPADLHQLLCVPKTAVVNRADFRDDVRSLHTTSVLTGRHGKGRATTLTPN